MLDEGLHGLGISNMQSNIGCLAAFGRCLTCYICNFGLNLKVIELYMNLERYLV